MAAGQASNPSVPRASAATAEMLRLPAASRPGGGTPRRCQRRAGRLSVRRCVQNSERSGAAHFHAARLSQAGWRADARSWSQAETGWSDTSSARTGA